MLTVNFLRKDFIKNYLVELNRITVKRILGKPSDLQMVQQY